MSYLSDEQFDDIQKSIELKRIEDVDANTLKNTPFDMGNADEYVEFLKENARDYDQLGITKTFLMYHKITKELIGYFTLSADTVKLTNSEKEASSLEAVQFNSIPAIKVGKLAINQNLSKNAKRKGYGSFALEMANTFAFEVLNIGVACRFLTVDADIEYNPMVTEFYKKNGFQENETIKKKNAKTISMRRDIYYE